MASAESTISPPVAKSGPLKTCISSACETSGLNISSSTASITSATLWLGMLVAIPTAMPLAPLASRLGNSPGKIEGSSSSLL